MSKKKILIYFLIMPFLLIPSNIKALKNGWIEENNETYYYVDDTMQKGILKLEDGEYLLGFLSGKLYRNGLATIPNGNVYLTDKDGKIEYGFHDVNKETYYFTKEGMYKGILELEDGDYLLGYFSGKLYRNGLATIPNGNVYLTDKDGKIEYGFHDVNKETYYFTKEGMYKGILELEDGDYLLGFLSGKLYRNGWAQIPDGNIYYTNEEGIIQKGDLKIEEIDYSFDEDGKLITGWQKYNEKNYYIPFGSHERVKGFKKVEEDVYYFDPKTREKVTGEIEVNHNKHILNSDGKLIKTNYSLSVYYSQKDPKWSEKAYGLSNISKTGCAPTSIAMAFSSILGKKIVPTDVADYLFYHTNEYNRKTKGSSGLAIIYASDYYKIKRTTIYSKKQLKEELENGKIVFASMGDGYFGTKKWNHAIVMVGLDKNKTYVQDPLSEAKNKWYSIDDIWQQQSKDPDDYSGGSNFYALERNYDYD